MDMAPIQLGDEVRAVWNAARRARASGAKMTVAVIGQSAPRAAQALAATSGIETVVFSATGVKGRRDWYAIEVETSRDGLPDGTEVTSRGTYRLPTLLADALIRPGDRIVIIQDVSDVPPDAFTALRGPLDEAPGSNPGLRGPVSPDVQVVFAWESHAGDVRGVLNGRIAVFIDLDRHG